MDFYGPHKFNILDIFRYSIKIRNFWIPIKILLSIFSLYYTLTFSISICFHIFSFAFIYLSLSICMCMFLIMVINSFFHLSSQMSFASSLRRSSIQSVISQKRQSIDYIFIKRIALKTYAEHARVMVSVNCFHIKVMRRWIW